MAERVFVPDPINTRFSEDQTGKYEDSVPVFIRATSGVETLKKVLAKGDEAVLQFGHSLIEAVIDTATSHQPRYFSPEGELKPRPKTDAEVEAMIEAAVKVKLEAAAQAAGVDLEDLPV
jgi:hypothetical protein